MAPPAGNTTNEDGQGNSYEVGELDSILRALSDRTRRYLLYLVKEHRSISFDEAGEKLTAKGGQGSCNPAQLKQLEMKATLHHYHLPRLIDVGLIEDNDSSGDLQYGPVPEDIERIIEAIRDYDR